MYKKRKIFQQVGIALLMSFSSTALFAANVADELVDTGGLTLSPTVSYDSVTLRVSSDSSESTTSFTADESIRVDAASLADGVYNYELLLSTASSDRANNPNSSVATQNGGFAIIEGVASANSDEEAEATAQVEKAEAEALAAASTPVLQSATED